MCYLECFEIATSSTLFQLLQLYRVFRNSLDIAKYSLGQHILQYEHGKLYNITKGVCHRAVTLNLLYIWHIISPDIVTEHISVDFQFQLNRLVNKEVGQ